MVRLTAHITTMSVNTRSGKKADQPEMSTQDMFDGLMKETRESRDAVIRRVDQLETRVSEFEMKINTDVCKLNDKVVDLETNINSNRVEMSIRMQSIETDIKDIIPADIIQMKRTIDLLSARLVRTELASSRMQDDLNAEISHSMKYNLVFHFDAAGNVGKEIAGESCVGIIKHFLGNTMHVQSANDMYIPVAHRLGKKNSGSHRPILAKFPIATQLEIILKHANRLKGTRHYVNKQCPPYVNERQQFAYPTYKANKGKSRMVNDKLIVNGKLQNQYEPPKLPNTNQSTDMDVSSISVGTTTQDSGSTFKGYALPTSSMEQVRENLNLLLQIPDVINSSHMIYAYRIDVGSGNITDNSGRPQTS